MAYMEQRQCRNIQSESLIVSEMAAGSILQDISVAMVNRFWCSSSPGRMEDRNISIALPKPVIRDICRLKLRFYCR